MSSRMMMVTLMKKKMKSWLKIQRTMAGKPNAYHASRCHVANAHCHAMSATQKLQVGQCNVQHATSLQAYAPKGLGASACMNARGFTQGPLEVKLTLVAKTRWWLPSVSKRSCVYSGSSGRVCLFSAPAVPFSHAHQWHLLWVLLVLKRYSI